MPANPPPTTTTRCPAPRGASPRGFMDTCALEPRVQLRRDVGERATLRLWHVAPDEQHTGRADGGEDPERRPLPDRVGERHEQQPDDEAREPVDRSRDAGSGA